MKKILLLTLTVISASIKAIEIPQPQPQLEKIMREHFNRGTSDQDLIEGRDKRGYTIIEVLIEKAAHASNTFELIELCMSRNLIKQEVNNQIEQALAKENRSTNNIVKTLIEKHTTNDSVIKALMGNLALYEIIHNNDNSIEALVKINKTLTKDRSELRKENSKLKDALNSRYSNTEFYATMAVTAVGAAIITAAIIK